MGWEELLCSAFAVSLVEFPISSRELLVRRWIGDHLVCDCCADTEISRWRRRALGRTYYGAAAFTLTALFLLSLFQTQDTADGAAKVAQLAFSWLVLIPVVVTLLYESRSPLKLIVRTSTIYVCLFILGWALVATVGIETLVSYSGTRRLFAQWDGMVFWWMPVVALALVRLGCGERLRLVDACLVMLSMLVVLANASRALAAAVGVATVYAAVLSFRARRGRVPRLLISVCVIGLLTVLFLNLGNLESYGLSNRYGRTGMLEDSFRSYMYEQALEAWLRSGTSFMFGIGLKFEVLGQGIHNVFLQTALFGGVIGLVAITFLLAAPVLAAGRIVVSNSVHRILVHFIRLNLLMMFPWFMTHPMQTSRWYGCITRC